MNQHKVLSLFCGAGGFDLGFHGGFDYLQNRYQKNNFNIIWANDINEKACKTAAHNFADTKIHCGDITKVNIDELPKADVILGGFPCQDYSLAGKRQGLNADRGNLYLSMVQIVAKLKPKVFLAENVKGLLIWEKGLAINKIIEDFENIGYNVQYQLLNAADYGVPQNRERVIIVGTRKDLNLQYTFPKKKRTCKRQKMVKKNG